MMMFIHSQITDALEAMKEPAPHPTEAEANVAVPTLPAPPKPVRAKKG